MRGLPQKQNARRADKIRLCGHLRRYKKIVKKTYIIYIKYELLIGYRYDENILPDYVQILWKNIYIEKIE